MILVQFYCDAALANSSFIFRTNNWSVMPLHSIASCVRPAYFMHGLINQPTFPATLGNMSKAGKNYRLLKELQLHMRLHISGDKTDVRQSYLPSLLPRLTEPLIQKATVGLRVLGPSRGPSW